MPSDWNIGAISAHGERSQQSAGVLPDSQYDTALPPVQDKSVSRRRPAIRPDSSMIIDNFRGMQRPIPLPKHESVSNIIAHAPGMHRRTDSTLKTVMRKIFHRKRRSQVDEFDEDSTPKPSQPHHSRPSLARPRPSEYDGTREKVEGKSHYPSSQSHSPLQIDMRPTLISLDRLHPIPLHQRRATLPSLIFSDTESHDPLHVPLDKDKPGPPTTNKSVSNLRTRRVLRSRRRSRSTNSLRKNSAANKSGSPIMWASRNGDATYLGSPTFGAVSDSELSCRPPTRTTIASMSKPRPASVTESEGENDEGEINERIAPSVGHVGNLINTMQNDDSVTLEQRMTTLEVKLIDLEFAIGRIQDKQGDAAPSTKKSPDTARMAGKQQCIEKPSPTPTPTPPINQGLDPLEIEIQERPVSTSTVRPNTLHRSRTYQLPSTPHPVDTGSSISIEQYSALVMLLRREQSARRHLESQISDLRDDVQQLQLLSRRSMSSTTVGTMYPIQSTDSADGTSRARHIFESPSALSSNYTTRSDKLTPPYDSADVERADLNGIRKLERRVEIAGMI